MKSNVIRNILEVETRCDVCGEPEDRQPFSRREIRRCLMCKIDVCSDCAIVTDYDHLDETGHMSHLPEHYCKSCWEKGEHIREQIHQHRGSIDKLWEQWRRLASK